MTPILRAIDEWYQTHTDDPTLEDIANLTFAAGVPEKQREYTKALFQSLAAVNGTETVQNLLESFKASRVCQDIALAAYEASEGRRPVSEVIELSRKLDNPIQVEEVDYVTKDLHVLLRETVLAPGLRWRLGSLNRSLGSLRKGNFGFVFARPETGKTTFLASEVTFMATQVPETAGPIIWFNNEEKGEVVQTRLYQATLGCRAEHLVKAPDRAMQAYNEAIRGKLELYDSASINRKQVEALCEREKPSLILFDQIDKIKGFKADRQDLVMGAIYQWSRELAKTYCPVIGVCQADGTAEGVDWLYMEHVADAKTAKQAEADFILGIGKKREAGFEEIRFLNISKNKLSGDEDTDRTDRHPKLTVRIRPEIARYEDL